MIESKHDLPSANTRRFSPGDCPLTSHEKKSYRGIENLEDRRSKALLEKLKYKTLFSLIIDISF